ncbi:4Fe-4S dicluster domain-containing protein [Thermodesulfobacteriota bacterium]
MTKSRQKKTELQNRQLLDDALREMSEECIECKICVKQCAFLKRYGTPKNIADRWTTHKTSLEKATFECSLCALCTALCPVDIDPREMFHAMRCHAVTSGRANLKKQKLLLNFEKRSTSRLYSFYGLPQGCDTVFFPGCALAGTRSHRVVHLYEHLQGSIPNLGIVLDCCTKPSLDLGRTDFFNAMFSEMQNFLAGHGIKQILTACPSCHIVFNKYADKLSAQSVYEILAKEHWQPVSDEVASGGITVQDSCVIRFDNYIMDSVRNCINALGIPFEEMKHHKKKTLCCGEGGGAHFVAPELAGQWSQIRRSEGNGKTIITYCAGCANFLGRIGQTAHLLDLLFDPVATLKGRTKVAKSPLTYLKRLLLKRKLSRKQEYHVTRERTFTGTDNP